MTHPRPRATLAAAPAPKPGPPSTRALLAREQADAGPGAPTTLPQLPAELSAATALLQRVASSPRWRAGAGLWFVTAHTLDYTRPDSLPELYRLRRLAGRPGLVAVAAFRERGRAVLHVEADAGAAARFTATLDGDGRPDAWALEHPADRLVTR